jgi:hypothetical protein
VLVLTDRSAAAGIARSAVRQRHLNVPWIVPKS